jgi:GNAT superfamily N-acetyltransferase
MELITISGGTVSLLHQFLTNPMPAHFRYFERRTPTDALRNHELTVVGVVAGVPIAYGHIDYETNYWIGLCVLPAYQRKGYGAQLLEYLISYARRHPLIDKLHLTVDPDNTGARALYERTGFLVEPVSTSAAVVRMVLTLKPIIHLPVSYGEAVDKLTILDIKLDMIRDARRLDVQKEYDAIYRDISGYLTDTIGYYYSILKDINRSIWVMQDQFRESTNPAEKNELCTKIIVENDRRFRVKSKVNNYFQSSLKEQKGYIPRKAFVLTHLGLGDMITANGIVRNLSTQYEKVVVVCKNMYLKNVVAMYSDDPTIEVYPVESDRYISPNYGADPSLLNRIKESYDVYFTGFHAPHRGTLIKELPFSFYDDVRMGPSVFWHYFHAPTTPTSKSLHTHLTSRSIHDYVFIHNTSSTGEVFSNDAIISRFGIDTNRTLVINTSKNIYPPEHPYFEAAQPFVMALIIDYKTTMEYATKVFVSDSSLFCFAMNLTPQRPDIEGYLVSRGAFPYDHIYSAKYAPPSTDRRIIFQQIRL